MTYGKGEEIFFLLFFSFFFRWGECKSENFKVSNVDQKQNDDSDDP